MAFILCSLYFDLIFVQSKLNPANNSGLNFQKYTPLIKLAIETFEILFYRAAYLSL